MCRSLNSGSVYVGGVMIRKELMEGLLYVYDYGLII